jgi:hypothetical protein
MTNELVNEGEVHVAPLTYRNPPVQELQIEVKNKKLFTINKLRNRLEPKLVNAKQEHQK